MNKKLTGMAIAALLLAFHTGAFAQGKSWPKEVKLIASEGGKTVSAEGDLSTGKIIEDLSWASSSSNACFPATQNSKFRGNHVFFATTMPPRSIMKISVTPTDEAANLSLYAYMTGGQEFRLVPNLPSCITCEADHKWDRPWKGKVQTHERRVQFQNPSQNTYNILIGVAAPGGVTSGAFKVEVKLEN